jgi:hypothetical protein
MEHRCQALKKDTERCRFDGSEYVEGAHGHAGWFCRVHATLAKDALRVPCGYQDLPDGNLYDVYESLGTRWEREHRVQCEALTAWVNRETDEPIRCKKMSPTEDHKIDGHRVCPTHFNEFGEYPRYGFARH